MPETSVLAAVLAFLVPLGYALIAIGGLSEQRARHVVVSTLASLSLALLGYVGTGFALQFGGVGVAHALPGLEGLVWEWSALGPTWGTGWGTAGLVGWGLSGPAATAGAYGLALAAFPWVATAALIPLACLRGRIPAWASGLLGLLVGALLYPLAGNWIWGGGWLANLGSNLGLGHGFVDVGGAGLVHVLGAAAALAGILIFLPRKPKATAPGQEVPLPPVHLPLLAVLGAGLLLVGSLFWTISNPLVTLRRPDLLRLALNIALAAAAGALLPLLYTWFVAGRTDSLMTVRGLAAATVAIAAGAPFVPPWAALAIGAAVGLLVVLVIFVVDHVLRWDDPTAALTVHGLAGALGLLGVGVFADGLGGTGWNGVGVGSYLGVAGQGVTGLLAATSSQADWPGQMQAQLVGLMALTLLGFFGAWLFLAPPALLIRVLRWRAAIAPAVSVGPEPQHSLEPANASGAELQETAAGNLSADVTAPEEFPASATAPAEEMSDTDHDLAPDQ